MADASKGNLIGAGIDAASKLVGKALETKDTTTTTTLPDYQKDPYGYLPGPLQNEFVKQGHNKSNWIGTATKNKGGLHRSLGIPEGQKIPKAKIAKAAAKG